MQHNSWKKDRSVLSEAYTQMNASGEKRRCEESEDQEDYDNILERLEKYTCIEEIRQIIIDFEDIIDDINNLEAPDQMIDAVELGIHLARLAPDTTKGSAF